MGSQGATPDVQVGQPAGESLPSQQIRDFAVGEAELSEQGEPCEGAVALVRSKVHAPEGQICEPGEAA